MDNSYIKEGFRLRIRFVETIVGKGKEKKKMGRGEEKRFQKLKR